MDLTLAAIIIMGGWVIAIFVAGLAMVLRPGSVAVRFASAGGGSGIIGRRDEILLGGDAEVFGNFRGRVRGVQVRADNRELQDIELAAGLEEEPVPATAILSADGQVLELADGWLELPAGGRTEAVMLRENATVVSADGKRLGKLRLVCFAEASRTVTGLVIEGRGTPSRRLLPIERVTAAAPERITTTLNAAEWTSLQPFATDWEIRQSVLQQLTADPALQPLMRTVQIDVQDQRVRLRGYVADDIQAQQLVRTVRSVPEIADVDLELVTDADLARAVRDALAHDAGTSAARVQVSAHDGTIDIAGEVPDRGTARAIERVVGQIPGVQVLHNMVAIEPSAATA